MLRKLDWFDSLGWEISGKDITDLVLDFPRRLRKQLGDALPEKYFATETPKEDPKRAVENVMESACQTAQNFEQLASVGRAITSFLMCVFSLGVLKLANSFSSFSKKAARIEERAERLLKETPTEVDAIKLWYDYQMYRSAAPLIPTWIWKSMQDDLNQLWKERHQ